MRLHPLCMGNGRLHLCGVARLYGVCRGPACVLERLPKTLAGIVSCCSVSRQQRETPKDMLELAAHIVETKSGHFAPEKFEDHYEDALKELLKKKQAGEQIEAPKERAPAKVINLMDALRRSVEAERGGSAKTTSPIRRTSKEEKIALAFAPHLQPFTHLAQVQEPGSTGEQTLGRGCASG